MVSTLIAYKDPNLDNYQLIVKRRSKEGVPIRAGSLHVVPSFMFQPTTSMGLHANLEYNVRYNILREILEEIYDYKRQDGDGNPHVIYHEPHIQYLSAMLENKTAHLYFTGVGINLMNLRSDICTLLVISDPEWYQKSLSDKELRWKFNNEFATIDDRKWLPAKQMVGNISLAKGSDGDAKMMQDGLIHPALTVPAGAAAFWLGVDTVREIQN